MEFGEGQRIQLPGENHFVVVELAQSTGGGWKLVVDDAGNLRKVELTAAQVTSVEVLSEDGGAEPAAALAGLWAAWMRHATQTASTTAFGTTPLRPYPHQNRAVYGAMLPQPLLRFLLADEPGTGKTIMGGLYLREMQRLGFVRRGLVVCPAHLVTKWQTDFERFFGGGLRRISANTIREDALSRSHDLWVVSLELVAVNPAVYEALHPDRAGWDVVIFDEAHRLTPTAGQYYRVGEMLATKTPRAVLMTATPHRGNEWLFRALMHLVDPKVYPAIDRLDEVQPEHSLKPGPLHFLRRMKEELVDYDGTTRLFRGRVAHNTVVPLGVDERAFYDEALDLVDKYFPHNAIPLAKMVYGKRCASSLYALAETLRRRQEHLNGAIAESFHDGDPYDEDDAERDFRKVIGQVSTASRDEQRAVSALFDRVNSVLADPTFVPSKWPKLVRDCLEPNKITPGGTEQLVVFTEFADTADWLVDRFTRSGFRAKRYSGRDPHWTRDEIRAQFANGDFQVIVSTDAGNEGIDLQSAHALVNWDVPWSLVRLEQRLGRIHRVGQTEVVHLHNLVATGTREGDAHARLLDSLCAAANELDGKIFDSLSLVGEVALEEAGVGDLEKLLAHTYELEDGSRLALEAIRALTKERLRQVHNRQRAAEDFLTSTVDMNEAILSLHEEALDRVNPHIVERFLSRIAAAGFITVTRSAVADEGLWLVGPGHLSILPQLWGSTPVLVATSGRAKQAAMDAGHAEAARAIALGPAEPLFRQVIDLCSEYLRPVLWRGGHLIDPTTVTNYELFVYEATENGRRYGPNLFSYLVRVDATGARVVPWNLLANLEAGDVRPKHLHPGHSAQAFEQANLAISRDLAHRKQMTTEWMGEIKNQLSHVPNDLTDHITDASDRKAARRRIEDAIQERIAELEDAVQGAPQPLALVGWAHVSGLGVPPDATEADSETIAMAHVANVMSGDGWQVSDVHLEGKGFDLYARKGRWQRCVEVKGVWENATAQGIDLTGNELTKAGLLGDDYWLYVVDNCRDNVGTLYAAYQNPAVLFADAVKDKPILHINGSYLKSAKEVSLS